MMDDLVRRCLDTAVTCDRAADGIVDIADKVYNLEATVYEAWRSSASSSLTNALVQDATLVNNAAGVLRGASTQFRQAAARLAHEQYQQQQEEERRLWYPSSGGR